jgi:signal transduction histidine kinase
VAGAPSEAGAPASPGGGDGRAELRRADVSRLWLQTLQELAGRSAHEVKNALNGLAVNLEVVRSRAEREGTPASAVASFAAGAAEQLELLTGMAEALLVLARAGGNPTDVGALLRRLLALLGPVARADGGVLRVVEPEGAAALTAGGLATRAPADAVRLALGAALLRVMAAGGDASVAVRAEGDGRGGVVAELRAAGRGARTSVPRLSEHIVAAASEAGIRVEEMDNGMRLVFPPAGGE